MWRRHPPFPGLRGISGLCAWLASCFPDNMRSTTMDATPEQRTYARLAGVMFLATYEETARYATESALLWRVSLAEVGASWIVIGVLAFALYAVLEPVNKRLAQLALCMRLGASFVGAASLMFRVAQARLYTASE